MNLLLFFLLAVQTLSVSPVIHTLRFLCTASSQVTNVADYEEVSYVDGAEILYYNSNKKKVEARQDWMHKIIADDPDYLTRRKKICFDREEQAKYYLKFGMEIFNQSGGLHVLQVMLGCEWDDESDAVESWFQVGYDGEDVLSLDMKTWTIVIEKPQLAASKHKWENDGFLLNYVKYYYSERCLPHLKKLVSYGRKVLMRTELPQVFILQKTASATVSCLATGFYPQRAALSWWKDGEELHEDVEHGEILPNHDGTFQMAVNMKVELTADMEGEYECVFQLSGVKEDVVTKLGRRSILSNASHEYNRSIAIGTTVAILTVVLLLAAIIIVRCHKIRQANYHPAAESDTAAGTQ